MRRVTCTSGIQGWQCRLRENYQGRFEVFRAYDEIYGIARRLGFESAHAAWATNPVIQGSVIPEDLRVVEPKSCV
jgi:hypothetical protein